MLARIVVAVVCVCASSAARADDGPLLSTSLSASVGVGPLPDDAAFERIDATVDTTVWHRLHVGLGGGLGMGSEASVLAEGFAEVGVWLHASPTIDVLLGWRLGRARFSIHDMPVSATMTASLIEVRLHVRPRVDLVIDPFSLTGYYNGLWAFIAGPSVGVAVPW